MTRTIKPLNTVDKTKAKPEEFFVLFETFAIQRPQGVESLPTRQTSNDDEHQESERTRQTHTERAL